MKSHAKQSGRGPLNENRYTTLEILLMVKRLFAERLRGIENRQARETAKSERRIGVCCTYIRT